MKYGKDACKLVGFPAKHQKPIQEVATQTNAVIAFRAVGSACTKLIEEGYAAKGFRVDTKSCNWGPMQGFVCVDPRLSKEGNDEAGVRKNRHYTDEALRGLKDPNKALGALTQADFDLWRSLCCPIIISQDRLAELIENRSITTRPAPGGHLYGETPIPKSRPPTDPRNRLRWRLIPLNARHLALNPEFKKLYDATPNKPADLYYVVCVNRSVISTREHSGSEYWQQYPTYLEPPIIKDADDNSWEVILGLTNPDSRQLGFKACITGDYDLFCVWTRAADSRRGAPTLGALNAADRPMAMRGDDVFLDWRMRPKDLGRSQHFRLGNISRHINFIKVTLNTALNTVGEYPGGNLVHHSDEVGNPVDGPASLAKPLQDCFPIIAFIPRAGEAFGIETLNDFGEFYQVCQELGYACELRAGWSPQIPRGTGKLVRRTKVNSADAWK